MHELALIGAELCYWWETAHEDAVPADAPAVYRWVVRNAQTGRVEEVFVGETGEGIVEEKATVAARLKEHRTRGHQVSREVLRFTHFEVAGKRVAPENLADRTVRRLLSNLFAFQHAQEGHRVVNA